MSGGAEYAVLCLGISSCNMKMELGDAQVSVFPMSPGAAVAMPTLGLCHMWPTLSCLLINSQRLRTVGEF